MLRIKDDSKKLEKHFIKLNIMDDDEMICSNVYCAIKKEYEEYIENECIKDYYVEFYIEDNEIKYCQYPECRDEDFMLDKIYDLIKDGLVEKVDE